MTSLAIRCGGCIAALTLAGGAAAATPGAAPQPAARQSPGVPPPILTVAMSGSYWPLHEQIDVSRREGLEADLAGDLAQLLGCQVRFVSRNETGSGSMEAVAAGKADIAIASITPTDERRKLVDFTRPYLVLHYRLAARRAGGDGPVETQAKKVAAPRGPAVAVARALLPLATVVEVASPDAAVQAVESGKADLAFAEDVGLVIALQGRPLSLVGAPLGESPLAVAVPKGKSSRYDEALAKLSGRIAQLVQKYRPGEPPELPDDFYLSFLGGVDEAVVRVHRDDASVSLDRPEENIEWLSLSVGSIEVRASVRARAVGRAPAAVEGRARKYLKDPGHATWLQFPDGTYLGFEEATTEQQCGSEEMGPDGKMVESSYACSDYQYRVVAVRGEAIGSTSFGVSEGT